MKVFIQKNNGEFIHESAFGAFFGFKALNYEVLSFENEAPMNRTKNDIVYGNIGVVLKAMECPQKNGQKIKSDNLSFQIAQEKDNSV